MTWRTISTIRVSIEDGWLQSYSDLSVISYLAAILSIRIRTMTWQFTSETHFTKFLLASLNCTTVWNVLDTESTISKLDTFQLLLQTVISNNAHHLIGNRPCPLPITSLLIPKIQYHIIRSTPHPFLAIPATSSG